MHLFRRGSAAARATSSARLSLEQLETRENPVVISGFAESVFASGLNTPTSMAVAPDGRIFVAEKGGALRVVQNGSVLPTPFLTVGVNTASERGLVGVTLDPNYSSNGFVYVYYTTNEPTPVNRVSRFTTSPFDVNLALPLSEVVLVDDIASTNGNHNGGALQFGPDGKLYIGTGEAGVPSNAQDLSNLSGKILRVNPNDGSAPSDNPFFSTSGVDPRIWAYGLRNPFTMAFQPGTGRLFINDVGSSVAEEVDEGAAGANYGWPMTEGFNPPGVPGVTYPIYAYAHGTAAFQGLAIAGGAFYNPASVSFPAKYAGDYFFGDFGTGRIFVRDSVTGAVSTLSPSVAGGDLVDLDVLPDGRLLYLSLTSGAIYQIKATNMAPGDLIAAGSGPGVTPRLSVFNPLAGAQGVLPAFPGYNGVRVATGDLTGDGVEDIVAASGPGGTPVVTIYDGATGQLTAAFFPFDPGFTGGLNVAVGDVTGDGRDDLIVSAASAIPLVAVFDPVTRSQAAVFLAFPGFQGGVTVAAGDVDGDGWEDVIVGTATGTSAVTVYSLRLNRSVLNFFAFAPFLPGGVNVGFANGDIVTGTASGPPVIRTFDSQGQQRLAFLAASPSIATGVRVAGYGDFILAAVDSTLFGFDRFTGALIGTLPAIPGFPAGDASIG